VLALQNEPLDVGAIMAQVTSPERGAVVTFCGVVRDTAANSKSKRKISFLHYEAHEAMALHQLFRLAQETQNKWPGVQVAAHHRLGRVLVGETAVVVAVGGVHRQESFEACTYFMNRLKEDVPIWKSEER
jgi:molybdopterin synthase catalytic subunit